MLCFPRNILTKSEARDILQIDGLWLAVALPLIPSTEMTWLLTFLTQTGSLVSKSTFNNFLLETFVASAVHVIEEYVIELVF